MQAPAGTDFGRPAACACTALSSLPVRSRPGADPARPAGIASLPSAESRRPSRGVSDGSNGGCSCGSEGTGEDASGDAYNRAHDDGDAHHDYHPKCSGRCGHMRVSEQLGASTSQPCTLMTTHKPNCAKSVVRRVRRGARRVIHRLVGGAWTRQHDRGVLTGGAGALRSVCKLPCRHSAGKPMLVSSSGASHLLWRCRRGVVGVASRIAHASHGGNGQAAGCTGLTRA
jgi:hypothetical protein